MDDKNSSSQSLIWPKSNKSTGETENNRKQEFWNGTLVDDYNYLMSEELICRCKSSLGEPFTSLNDLSVHHVSYNEFEKQYGELSHWCEKIYDTITKISSNALTRYLRQKYYEELYEQGLMRLRMFGQYADKLIERFPDLKLNINDKTSKIGRQWSYLESRFIDYLDEDFDQILHDLHNELILFEEWLSKTEAQLWTFESIRTDDISLEDFQFKLHQHTKLQDEIKSRNSRVSSIIEICERLKNDYEQQAEQVPFDLASDLENQWHQIWLNSVEIQCKLEDRLRILQNTTPLIQFNQQEEIEEEDDIIPFNPSEYEKIPLTPSNSSVDSLNISINKRRRSPSINNLNINCEQKSFHLKRRMATSKQRMSLNLLPINSPSTFYYSLTNINDFDDQIMTKKQKRTLSKLDVGYESEDENNHMYKNVHSIYKLKKSFSDHFIREKQQNKIGCTSLTHSLPTFEHNHLFPAWGRHSITSAYDTCSNPDIDLSIEETKRNQKQTSLLMYSKKYVKYHCIKSTSDKQLLSLSPVSNIKKKNCSSNPASNSYDASAEYTDPDQSENDVDILSSDFNSGSPIHHIKKAQTNFYNRYITTTTITTKTGYSSDMELETKTIPSETDDQRTLYTDEVSQIKPNTLNLASSITSNEFDSSNTMIMNEKFESSEPCWDGYQSPLFYPLNSQDVDSIETTLKWEDQFLEMDQPNNSSSDAENQFNENYIQFLRNIDSSSSSLTGGVPGSVGHKQTLDSDSDLDDFNYVLNETERQLYKARQSLEKKKRQQSFALNDRNIRKYDEVLRTCETNIQCLQQILKNLHRSKNSRLNSIKTAEQLQTYLSDWHDMQQQVNDERISARRLLHISQEVVKLKLHLDEELSRINFTENNTYPWLENSSLIELMHRINYEIQTEKESRQKIASLRSDIHQVEEHLKEYRMSNFNGPSSSNIDGHLHTCRLSLEQLTNKMDTYQTQLRTLSTMVDKLLPIERQIEQKLNTSEYNNHYQFDLPDMQKLINKYEQIIYNTEDSSILENHLYLKLKSNCESKLDIYKKILNDIYRKSRSKHVSFDDYANLNNNNSSVFATTATTSSSSSSSTPQQYIDNTNDNIHQKSYRRKETHSTFNDINRQSINEQSNRQSSTSSYISDDCKVLYIETVIEVAKPVFYERTNDTITSTNEEYHHHHHQPNLLQSTVKNQRSTKNFYIRNKELHESSDDDSHEPVNITKNHHRNKFLQVDSGIEYDQTTPPTSSSSSTICNQRIFNKKNENQLLFSPLKSNSMIDEKPPSTLIRRLNLTKTETTVNDNIQSSSSTNSYWNRLKQIWLRSLLLGLLLLLILFFVYFSRLDTCSRSTMVRAVFRKIICVEHEGLPTL